MTALNTLTTAPLLVEIFRGHDRRGDSIIERAHHGVIAVVDGKGDLLYHKGDVDYFAHLRSCAKPFQILPLFEMGFFESDKWQHLHLKASDIVLMMSSHAGQTIHTSRVNELLSAVNLDHKALRCGVHPPQDTATFCELLDAHLKPNELHNNCSGKHLGMILACLHQGLDRNSYEDPHHPLQDSITKLIALIADFPSEKIAFGIDGCSLPSLALPLKALALMYARLSYWATTTVKGMPPYLSRAFRIMWDSVMAHPEFLAGDKRFDTAIIKASNRRIFSKCGADGLLALAIAPTDRFPHGLGIAIKIVDGDPKQQIRALIAREILDSLDLWPNAPALLEFLPSTKNFRGLSTGETKVHCRIPHKAI